MSCYICPHLMTTAAGKNHAVVFILGVTKGYLKDNFKVKIERIAIESNNISLHSEQSQLGHENSP